MPNIYLFIYFIFIYFKNIWGHSCGENLLTRMCPNVYRLCRTCWSFFTGKETVFGNFHWLEASGSPLVSSLGYCLSTSQHQSIMFCFVLQSYFYNDDNFNYNYAQAKASVGNFKEAEEVFNLIQSEKIKSDYTYLSWLARCCE